MALSEQELRNKKEARKLVGLPAEDRPENVLFSPASKNEPDFYRVIMDGEKEKVVVCFQITNGRFVYLGEWPISTQPDLAV